MFVGNGFIRSETPVNIRGSLNGEWSVHTLGNGLAHSVGEAAFVDAFITNSAGYSDNLTLCQIIGCGNSASRSERINPLAYAHIETLSTQQTRQTPICPLRARMATSMAICLMKNAGQGYPITNGEKTEFTDFFPEIYSGTIVDFTGGAYTLPWVSEMRLS